MTGILINIKRTWLLYKMFIDFTNKALLSQPSADCSETFVIIFTMWWEFLQFSSL